MFFSALSESLWTKTLKELIKYTTKAPYTYLSGLLILSEMLPLPLPIQTREVRGKGRSQSTISQMYILDCYRYPLPLDCYRYPVNIICSYVL